jgi:hypothetical protein
MAQRLVFAEIGDLEFDKETKGGYGINFWSLCEQSVLMRI